MKKDITLFLIVSALLGLSQSVDYSIFNNYLSDIFHITVFQRTLLEIPRELPGFLIVFVSGVLFFVGDVRMASIASMISAAGFFCMGFASPDFAVMTIWLMVYHTGTHLNMPLSNSIALSLAEEGQLGKRLGQVNSANTAMFLLGSLLIMFLYWILGESRHMTFYKYGFMISAIALVLAAILLLFMTPYKPKDAKFKLVFRKEYKLYYILCLLYGARKQIFITFGPWVLIKIFNQTPKEFAILGLLTAFIGIFFKPLFGHLIDKWGERKVMIAESTLLLFVFGGYAFSQAFFNNLQIGWVALYVISACYILDQLLSAVVMARATYIKKIAVHPEDISPTLSMGISIDHIVSMSLPWVGGFVWITYGYQYVFLGGMAVVFAGILVAMRIKTELKA